MARIIRIDFIDYGVAGEYGFFGKRVATSDVRHMSVVERAEEIVAMRRILGDHVTAVEVEEIAEVAA